MKARNYGPSGQGGIAFPAQETVLVTTSSRVCTLADYGKLILFSYSGAVAVTLPANGATVGAWFEVAQTGAGGDATAITVSPATVTTLIGPNSAALTSVTWGSGHRINSRARFWSDGSYWHVENLGGTTMTYNS